MLISWLMTSFPDWLNKELADREMSPAELSRLMKKDQGIVSRILRGERSVGNDTLIAIAHALNIPPETVFRAAGILPPSAGPLSEEQQAVIHAVSQVRDNKTLRMISAMLDQAIAEMDKDKQRK